MKKKSKSQDTVSYTQITPQRTADDDRADAALAEADQADPSLSYSFANQKRSWNNHINDQFGADYSPETAAAMKFAGENEIDQQHGQAMAVDRFRRKQTKFGNSLAIRNARAPQIVRSGGTSTTEENSADFWNNLIGSGVGFGIGVAKSKL